MARSFGGSGACARGCAAEGARVENPCHQESPFGIASGGIISEIKFTRITRDPLVMGGKACIRGMRVTVGMVVGLVASRRSFPEILAAYPYLEEEDIREALRYAAWRFEEP